MKKTLVLAVDRDNDFGEKAGVVTPVLGIEAALDAALRLGAVDPEDSDVNSLFAAIKIYHELSNEGKEVQIALICGNKKVGHVSDAAVVDELEVILDEVKPDRVILVSDGAEDEYVYPIISSRVPIDSVKKVFVKQAPGLEGSLYIISRMLRDSNKRRRFLAPLGWLMIIIGLILILPNIYRYVTTDNGDYLFSMTGSLVLFVIGVIFTFYAYDTRDKLQRYYDKALNDVKNGNMGIIFTVMSFALVIVGIVIGLMEVSSMHDISWAYMALMFASNFLWFFVFAVICDSFGKFLDTYVKERKFSKGFMIGTISVLALAFVIQAILDIFCSTLGYAYVGEGIIVYEFIIGIGFGLCAAVLQMSFKEYFDSKKIPEETDIDAVQ